MPRSYYRRRRRQPSVEAALGLPGDEPVEWRTAPGIADSVARAEAALDAALAALDPELPEGRRWRGRARWPFHVDAVDGAVTVAWHGGPGEPVVLPVEHGDEPAELVARFGREGLAAAWRSALNAADLARWWHSTDAGDLLALAAELAPDPTCVARAAVDVARVGLVRVPMPHRRTSRTLLGRAAKLLAPGAAPSAEALAELDAYADALLNASRAWEDRWSVDSVEGLRAAEAAMAVAYALAGVGRATFPCNRDELGTAAARAAAAAQENRWYRGRHRVVTSDDRVTHEALAADLARVVRRAVPFPPMAAAVLSAPAEPGALVRSPP